MELKNLLRTNITKQQLEEEVTRETEGNKTYGIKMDLKDLSYLFHETEEKIQAMNSANNIDINLNLYKGNFLKQFLKRVIRKLTWWILQPIVTHQKWYNELNAFSATTLLETQKNIVSLISEQIKRNKEFKDMIESMEREIEVLREKLEEAVSMIEKHYLEERKFQLLSQEQEDRLYVVEESLNRYIQRESLDDIIDYTAFQEKFRGTRDEIKSRLERYKQYFSKGDVVLDIGCGRGEMIEILLEVGAKVIGVDRNEVTVKQCVDSGYSVYLEDAFVYLGRMYDHFFDGITCIQMIEHISTKSLVELIELCKKKLKTGGILILETPNPRVLSTFAINFYVDPTHLRPVHPEFLKYVLEEKGFSVVKEDYPEYSWVTDGTLPKLECNGVKREELDSKIDFLNNILYGSMDYAIIARKM